MTRTSLRTLVATAALALSALGCSSGGDSGTNPPPPPTGTGTVSGQVTSDGQGVAGASIAIAGGGSTTTAANGSYTIANVPVGERSVSITLPQGMITATAAEQTTKTATVAANQTATVNWTLKAGVQVTAGGTSFTPQNVTVPVGGTVRWVNGGGDHTVTPTGAGQPGAWASAVLGPGVAFEHTFGAATTVNYHCIPHQAMGMTGTVTVQ